MAGQDRVSRVIAPSLETRNLFLVLGYTDYRNFEAVVEKARTACVNSGQRVDDHFVGVTEMVGIGSGAERAVKTVMMSRYACYLVIQNAEPTAEGNRSSTIWAARSWPPTCFGPHRRWMRWDEAARERTARPTPG